VMVEGTIVQCPSCSRKNRVRATPTGVPRCSVCHTLLPWMVEADKDSFDAEITASVPVLIDFWAPWCGPCRMISPALERLAGRYAGQLKLVKLNVDEAPDISSRFGVQGIPLIVLWRNGGEVDRMVGAVPERDLEAWLRRHVDVDAAAPA
jgi:thioredoxin 2